ncbi:DUF2171 domain-containing protein [Acinetobacter sp.]|jgi:hypothetical protein|uniref:DUF2171 domain-containing protein n=1 Tax=Acinetobacter sp. TaxID=472 RepID=UPI002FCA6D64
MVDLQSIQKHADVIASCGTKVGTVDHLEGTDQLKLTRHESSDGMHHLIPVSWVQEIRDNQVMLNKCADEVRQQWKAV